MLSPCDACCIVGREYALGRVAGATMGVQQDVVQNCVYLQALTYLRTLTDAEKFILRFGESVASECLTKCIPVLEVARFDSGPS
jgi:hypothetical protein